MTQLFGLQHRRGTEIQRRKKEGNYMGKCMDHYMTIIDNYMFK